jgi:hypothetical protein
MQLTAARWSCLLGLLLFALAGSCTKDFSHFQFSPQSGHDGGNGGSDAGALPSRVTDSGVPDAADGRAGMDAPQGGSSGSKGGAGGAAGRRTPPNMGGRGGVGGDDLDSSVPEGGSPSMMPDAGPPTDEEQCSSAYPMLLDDRAACRSCTCEQCTDPALDCLMRADAYERTACTELWKCAIANNCHDWDCYCSSQRCRMTPSAPGDGPCFMQMEMAAGGDREAVNAAHLNDDPKNPLVRAIRAIGCSVGTPAGSVGGMIAPMCQDSCARDGAN